MWPFRSKATAAQSTPLADATRGQHPDTVRGLLMLAGYTADQLSTVTIGRKQAMAIPALKNGVGLYSSIANRLPLTTEDLDGVKIPAHRSNSWLSTLDPDKTRGWTIVQTLRDLMFNEVSFWHVLSYNASGFPATSEHVDLTRIQVIPPSREKPTGGIQIDSQDVDLTDIIRFDGIADGLLISCQEALQMAYNNVRAASRYAANPMPSWVLVDSDPNADPLDPDDAASYVDTMTQLTANKAGGGYVGGVRPESLSWNAREIQLVEARQQDAVDMARLIACPTRYVAAPAQGAELTYANLADVRRDLYENGGLACYLPVIEDRLSLPDCTPTTTRVRFDPDSFFGQVVDQAVTPGGQDTPQPAPLPSEGRHMHALTARRVEAHQVITATHDVTLGEGLSKVTAVSADRRTIEGLIVPWGEVGYAALNGNPQPMVFEKDSLIWLDTSTGAPEIPLVVNHSGMAPVFAGHCVAVWVDDAGMWGRWKILSTRAGDEALVEAGAHDPDEAVRAGLSLEALIPDEAVIDISSGILTVTAKNPALLERTALVDKPAFNKAGVSRAVAAQAEAAEVPDDVLTKTIETLTGAVSSFTEVASALQQTLADQAAEPAPEAAPEAPAAARRNPTGGTTVAREPFPYGHPGAEGESFFKDLYVAGSRRGEAATAAAERVDKAHRMWNEQAESRQATGSLRMATAAGEPIPQANVMVPNQYDVGLYVEQLRFPRKLVDGSPKTAITGPNPFLYPKFASSTADGGSGEVVTAHTEGTNPVTGELDIDTITATPLPYSGTFDINREAVDGGSPGMDQILFGALEESYNQVTELAAWTALYATSGITSPTSVTTDANLHIEARSMLMQIRAEQAAFDVRRGIGPDRIFFGAGVWAAALEAESAAASGEPLYPYYNPNNRDAQSTNSGTVAVDVRGTPGESAKQATSAKVTQLRFADTHTWESQGSTFRWEEVVGPAKIRFSLFKYFVFKVVQPLGVTVHTQA